MIPKVTQDGPNIAPRYFCSVCSTPLRDTDPITGGPSGWKFCYICGSPIEWEKAGPPILKEFTVLITFEDGGTVAERVVGTERTVGYTYPIGGTLRRGTEDQCAVIAKAEIINVREFTQEEHHGKQ